MKEECRPYSEKNVVWKFSLRRAMQLWVYRTEPYPSVAWQWLKRPLSEPQRNPSERTTFQSHHQSPIHYIDYTRIEEYNYEFHFNYALVVIISEKIVSHCMEYFAIVAISPSSNYTLQLCLSSVTIHYTMPSTKGSANRIHYATGEHLVMWCGDGETYAACLFRSCC